MVERTCRLKWEDEGRRGDEIMVGCMLGKENVPLHLSPIDHPLNPPAMITHPPSSLPTTLPLLNVPLLRTTMLPIPSCANHFPYTNYYRACESDVSTATRKCNNIRNVNAMHDYGRNGGFD